MSSAVKMHFSLAPWAVTRRLDSPARQASPLDAFPQTSKVRQNGSLVMGTSIFPSYDPTQFPLQAYRNASQRGT